MKLSYAFLSIFIFSTANAQLKCVDVLNSLNAVAKSPVRLTTDNAQAESVAQTRRNKILKILKEQEKNYKYGADQKINEILGLDFQSVEESRLIKIRARANEYVYEYQQLPSLAGEAKWSRPNTSNGWSTPYLPLSRLLKALKIKPNQTFVDVGSGFGAPGFLIGSLYPQTKYLGYEIVKERIAEARRVVNLNQFKNVAFKRQDLSDSNFQIKPADYYYFYDPVNDSTCRIILDKIKDANKDKSYKLILKMGGNGEYLQIFKEFFGEPREIADNFSHYYVFSVDP